VRKFDFLEIVLALLTVVVVLAIVTTVMALAYPDVTASVVRDVRQKVDQGDSPIVALTSRVGKRFADGLDYRVRPFVTETVEKIGIKIKENGNGRRPAKVASAFKAQECLTCHNKLFEERAVTNLYVDHRVHESLDIGCADCHSDTKHPKPKPVDKQICVDCHEARGAETGCDSCHPPGSIKEVVAEAKTDEFLRGRSLQQKSLTRGTFVAPDRAWLDHSGEGKAGQGGLCADCHLTPEFCNRCHLVFHDKLANWTRTHGSKLLALEYAQTGCWRCHSSTWCAAACHSRPELTRRKNFIRAPLTPLADYVR
jgi:hypothetical protein